MFGATTATTTFGSFGQTAGAAAAPAFGSPTLNFGKPAAATTPAPAFGSFGAPAATAPAFGSPQPAATAANTFAFGNLGKPAATTTPAFGSGFGTTFGQPAATTAAPATAAPALGFGSFGSFGSQQAQAPAPAKPAENIPFDTPYKELPAPYKAELDDVFKSYKDPMRNHLALLQRSKGQSYDELVQQLKKLHLAVMKLEAQQVSLKNELQPFLEDIKPFYRDFRTSAGNGLAQIRSRFAGEHQYAYLSVLDEDLPDHFFVSAAQRIERRLVQCVGLVQYYEQQLAARIRVLERRQIGVADTDSIAGGRGAYGQVMRVSPAMLLAIMKQQAELFAQVAAEVAMVHSQVDDLRLAHLRQRRSHMDTGNPFEAADRKEQADRKQTDDKIRLEQQIQQQQSQQQKQLQQPVAGATTTAAAAPAANAFSFGGAPAATAAAPVAGALTFGAPAAAAPATAGALTFGAPAAATSTAGLPIAPTLNFGAPAAAAAPAASAFSFGGSTSTTAALDLAKPAATVGFGSFGAAPTTSSSFPGIANTVSPINIKAATYEASALSFSGTHKPTKKK